MSKNVWWGGGGAEKSASLRNLKPPRDHQTPVTPRRIFSLVTHSLGPAILCLHIGRPHVSFSRADVGAHSRKTERESDRMITTKNNTKEGDRRKKQRIT